MWGEREWYHYAVFQSFLLEGLSPIFERLTLFNLNLDVHRSVMEHVAFTAICWHISAIAPNDTELSDRFLDGYSFLCCYTPVTCGALHTDCKNTRMSEFVHHSALHSTDKMHKYIQSVNVNLCISANFLVGVLLTLLDCMDRWCGRPQHSVCT